METIEDYLNCGLLYGLNEDEYGLMVDLFNLVKSTERLTVFKTPQTTLLFPIIGRLYYKLRVCRNNDSAKFEFCYNTVVQKIPTYARKVNNTKQVLDMMGLAFPTLDCEAEYCSLMCDEIYLSVLEDYKMFHRDTNANVEYAPSYKAWLNNKK
jgi:hypothetical protein